MPGVRSHTPRFPGDNLQRDLELVEALRKIAEETDITVPQAAITRVASPGDDIVPIVGARTRERLTEPLGAADVALSSEQRAAIEAAMPAAQVAGTRYAKAQMAMLDSER